MKRLTILIIIGFLIFGCKKGEIGPQGKDGEFGEFIIDNPNSIKTSDWFEIGNPSIDTVSLKYSNIITINGTIKNEFLTSENLKNGQIKVYWKSNSYNNETLLINDSLAINIDTLTYYYKDPSLTEISGLLIVKSTELYFNENEFTYTLKIDLSNKNLMYKKYSFEKWQSILKEIEFRFALIKN